MEAGRVLAQILWLFLVVPALIVFGAEAFTGTYGINYGRLADNIPSPDKVVKLLKASKIKNVRIFDSDQSVLEAFSGSGLELTIAVNNGLVKEMSSNEGQAVKWVKENVESYQYSNIVGVAVGNEVLGGDQELSAALLGAVKNIYAALQKAQLSDKVMVSTAHSQAVFNNSFPPSSCVFAENVVQYMKPLLDFFASIGSPFCLNAYPFLAFMYNPGKIDINYALFEKTTNIFDPKTGLYYDNLLDAQIDAAYSALANSGYKKMEVIVTETGWASRGDANEAAANLTNARTFNYNLRKRLAKKKGTPLRPKIPLKAYIFAMFNENQKTGPTSERNFGLFKADGSIAYDIGYKGLKSSSADSSLKLFKDLRYRSGYGSYLLTFMMCTLSSLLFLTR
uniref:glucan endo-1,3-beta-D-glucosidase n=1 Tax=Kalanchoe fedtschenkoi TaxID=63787 RepID=A0A7N0ZTU2_KALFE